MARAREDIERKEVTKVVETKVIHMTLSEDEAEYLHWLTGKCNGFIRQNTSVHNALCGVVPEAPADSFSTIQTIESKWHKPRSY